MNTSDQNPVRARIISDSAALLSLTQEACSAMASHDEAKVLCLFCGKSQRKIFRQLEQLIEDLRACRSAEDLPGECPEVTELRNASFKVFRGLTLRVGNPIGLTAHFRKGAVEFFRMLVRQDETLLLITHRRFWRQFAAFLLFVALKANQGLLQFKEAPAALLKPLNGILRMFRPAQRNAYEVSISEAAEALNMSQSQVKQWDRGILPDEFMATYPGRFLRIPFYQWATAHRAHLRFARSIHSRTVLMTHPEMVAEKRHKPA